MPHKKRHNYTAEEKVAILREHLLDKIPVSQICDKYRLQPNLFYQWQRKFFENGASALRGKSDARDKYLTNKIEKLEAQISRKNEVMSELLEAHTQLKKELGEL